MSDGANDGRRASRIVLWTVLALVGCGSESATVPPSPDPAAAKSDAESQSASAPRPVPPTADAALRTVVAGLAKDDPRAIWEYLPPSYRRDVNGLVHEFAGRMDPVVWSRGFATARHAAKTLRAKREFILAHPALRGTAEKPGPLSAQQASELAAHWDGTIGLVETIVDSDLADAERLKSIDVGTFLDRTGSRLLKQVAALSALLPNDPYDRSVRRTFGTLEATLISTAGETAVVRLQSSVPVPTLDPVAPVDPLADPFEAPPAAATPTERDVEFVRVEGQWIPKTLRDGWQPQIAEWRAKLQAIPPQWSAADRQRALDLCDALDAFLTKVDAAPTATEFERVVGTELPALFARFASTDATPGESPPSSTPPPVGPGGDAITVSIRGVPNRAELERLQDRLSAVTDDLDDAVVVPLSTGEKIELQIVPVRDVARFAAQIDFAKVVTVDAAGRRIDLQWTPPEPRK